MAKGKSLLNQTPTKPKKQNKYSEISDIKKEYKFDLKDRVVFLGISSEYRGLECTIVKRNIKKKTTDYYNVQFDDGKIIESVVSGFLKTIEEYELEKETIANNNAEIKNNLSEFEIELNKQGIESYHNYAQCLDSPTIVEMRCNECGFEDRCVYRDKYNYNKFRNL